MTQGGRLTAKITPSHIFVTQTPQAAENKNIVVQLQKDVSRQGTTIMLRRICTLALLLVAVSGLPGCGGGGGGGGGVQPPPPPPPVTTLSWDNGNWDELNWQ